MSSATTTANASASSEIWSDYGFGATERGQRRTTLAMHIGVLSRGFLSEDASVVVVTDAEIFGRYKVQRPRRLKSAHAQAARSALDIDFTEFEEGDYVVHLQHGIGRYVGLKVLPVAAGRKNVDPMSRARTKARNASSSNTRRMIPTRPRRSCMCR